MDLNIKESSFKGGNVGHTFVGEMEMMSAQSYSFKKIELPLPSSNLIHSPV